MLTINTNLQRCTCSIYHNKLVCKHLVAACMKDAVWLSGFKLMPKQLRTVRKRKQNISIEIRLKEIEEQEEQRVENPVAQKKPRGRPKKGEQEK